MAQATEAASERTFSSAGEINRKKRRRLNSEMLDDITLIHSDHQNSMGKTKLLPCNFNKWFPKMVWALCLK